MKYAVDTFQNQVLFRKIVSAFQDQKSVLQENPKQALAQINADLNDISVIYDEDVAHYNTNADNLFKMNDVINK